MISFNGVLTVLFFYGIPLFVIVTGLRLLKRIADDIGAVRRYCDDTRSSLVPSNEATTDD